VDKGQVKITNKVRRTVAVCGIGWGLAGFLPGMHFTVQDGTIIVLAVAIYVMSLFIKEDNAIR
jgi:hypothetical protein